MNKKEAAKAWHVNKKEVERVCKHMQVDEKNIPENLQPVYVPSNQTRADPHRFYIYVLEVIANPVFHLEGYDETIIQSCVTQLHHAGLIVLKAGADPDSANYRDYLISADRERFYQWNRSKLNGTFDAI